MAYFNYLLESSICITAFYLVYHFFLRQEKLFHLNRFYLVVSLFISMLLPLISISLPEGTPVYLYDYNFNDGLLVNAPGTIEVSSDAWSWGHLLISIYGIGVLVLFSKFIGSCLMMMQLIKTGTKTKYSDYTLVLIEQDFPVSSFWNYVFLYKNHTYSAKEKNVILAHEIAHIKERHTIDILLTEAIKILLWFNPIVYIFQRKLKEVHEYLADAAAIDTTCTPLQYATLMMQEARKQTTPAIPVTHFFHNQIKNRLIMLGKIKKPVRGLKALLSLPVVLALFLAFSMQGELLAQFGRGDVPNNAVPGKCYAKCLVIDKNEEAAEWKEVLCPHVITPKLLKELRQKLKNRGYAIAAVELKEPSKKMSQNTKSALTQYQKDNNLPLGNLDVRTYKSLGIKVE